MPGLLDCDYAQRTWQMSPMRIERGDAVHGAGKVGRWINVGESRFWVPNDLPYEDGAPSAILIAEKPRHSRVNVRRNAPVLALAVEKRCA